MFKGDMDDTVVISIGNGLSKLSSNHECGCLFEASNQNHKNLFAMETIAPS